MANIVSTFSQLKRGLTGERSAPMSRLESRGMRWPFDRRDTIIWFVSVIVLLVVTNVFGLLIGLAALFVVVVLTHTKRRRP